MLIWKYIYKKLKFHPPKITYFQTLIDNSEKNDSQALSTRLVVKRATAPEWSRHRKFTLQNTYTPDRMKICKLRAKYTNKLRAGVQLTRRPRDEIGYLAAGAEGVATAWVQQIQNIIKKQRCQSCRCRGAWYFTCCCFFSWAAYRTRGHGHFGRRVSFYPTRLIISSDTMLGLFFWGKFLKYWVSEFSEFFQYIYLSSIFIGNQSDLWLNH